MKYLACSLTITALGCVTPPEPDPPPADPASIRPGAAGALATGAALEGTASLSSALSADDTIGNGGACKQINFHGGPVLGSAKIQNIFWGSYWNTAAGSARRAEVDQAWNTIGNNRAFYSPFWQYGAGLGRYLGAATNNTDPPAQVYDSDVQAMLRVSIFFGLVPVNDANMLYVVYLPAGTTSHPDLENGWGAHHDSFQNTLSNGYVFYATVTAMTTLDSLTLLSSHEVDEAIADPNPRYAQGWDEVGDPCQSLANRGYRFNGYLLERVYSDADCGCVSTVARPLASKHDIVWRNMSNGWVSLWQMNGSASVRTFADVGQAGTNWQILGTGDFNGDGESDLLWQDSNTGNVTSWLMRGTSVLSFNTSPGMRLLYASVVGVGDFDGDGVSDVLWRSWFDSSITISYGGDRYDGNPYSPAFPAGSDWTVQGTGDLNGDRRSDIVWRQASTGAVAVWLMNGSTAPATPLVSAGVTADWQVAGVGDFDGDGKDDILWRNTIRGDVGLWLMNGGTALSFPTVWNGVELAWQIKAVGDLDGDGRSDIIWRNVNTGDVGAWRMNGAHPLSMDAPKLGVPPQWQIQGTTADQTF